MRPVPNQGRNATHALRGTTQIPAGAYSPCGHSCFNAANVAAYSGSAAPLPDEIQPAPAQGRFQPAATLLYSRVCVPAYCRKPAPEPVHWVSNGAQRLFDVASKPPQNTRTMPALREKRIICVYKFGLYHVPEKIASTAVQYFFAIASKFCYTIKISDYYDRWFILTKRAHNETLSADKAK